MLQNQLPSLITADDEQDAWNRRCSKAAKLAQHQLVSKCAIPPLPLLMAITMEKDIQKKRNHRGSVLVQAQATKPDSSRGESAKGGSSGSGSFKRSASAPGTVDKHLIKLRNHARTQVAYSPQGLFARKSPPVGARCSETGSRFWDALRSKEDDIRQRSAQAQAAAVDALRRQSVAASIHSASPKAGLDLPLEELARDVTSPEQRQVLYDKKKHDICMFDIREGVRLLILGLAPSPLGTPKLWPPKGQRREGSKEEAITVYLAYVELEGMSTPTGDEEVRIEDTGQAMLPSGEEAGAEERPMTNSVGIAETGGLPPINWPTIQLWVESKQANTEDARCKLVCATLLKALDFWRGTQASPQERRDGVFFHTILRWIWPTCSPNGISRMFAAIALTEIDKITHPTPPLISDEERKAIEALFLQMDSKGKGYLTAADLAGGDSQDIQTRLKNTIDAETVRVILGADCKVDLNRFFELMCEDGYCGHPEVTRVICDDGLGGQGSTGIAIVKVEKRVLSYEGWWLEDVPAKEVSLRRRIDALEAEVKRWRTGRGGSSRGSPSATSSPRSGVARFS